MRLSCLSLSYGKEFRAGKMDLPKFITTARGLGFDGVDLHMQHLKSFHPAEVRVAVLHDKQVSTFFPDYYVAKVRKWRWIIYPWAVIEDVSGLLGRMAERPATPAEAAQVFMREFACRLPRQIVEDVYDLAGWASGQKG